MVKQHHRLNGYEFEQTPGDGEGQGSLVCCSPSGSKELDTTQLRTHTVIFRSHRKHLIKKDFRNIPGTSLVV